MPFNTVFVFAKPNRIGLSKTRLARGIGAAEARRVNAMMTARVMRAVTDPRWQTGLMVTPERALDTREPSWPDGLTRISQGEGDLGARLTRAFDLAPIGNVLFLGTDQPDLTRADIWTAIKTLQTHGAVFGPADDGGFWLMGMKKRVGTQPPFTDVRWSSQHTLADVRSNLENTPVAMLDTRIDLDDAAALRAWKSN